MPRQHTTNDPTYKRNRKQLLADNPVCHWCGTNAATEADHLTPYVAGGSDDLENLVPACKPCNASRGAKLGNQRRANTKHGQPLTPAPNTVKPLQNKEFFFKENTEAPARFVSYIPNQPELAETSHNRPRLETTTPDHAQTRADEILGISKTLLGIDLMPWQYRVAQGLTAMDDEGNYLRRIGLSSVARQCGKTQLMAALIAWHLTIEGPRRGTPQLVISVAHKLDLAVSLFKYLAPYLEEHYGATVSWSYGRNELTVLDPAGVKHRWLVRAATPQAGHGYSADLITVDEVWNVSEAAIDEGLLPTQRARRNPLFCMFSTAGTQHSTAMLRWRSQGLKQIDAGDIGPMYFASWEPPPGLDPMTPEAWAYANPALGYTLDMSVLEAEAKGPNRSAFLRSSVNIWVAASTGWLEPGLFETLTTNQELPAGGVLSIESSLDGGYYVGVRAVQVEQKTLVTVAFHVESLAAMWQAVEKELSTTHSLRLALPPSLEISCPPKWEPRRTIVGYRELGKWTAPVRAMITEGRIAHTGSLLLMEHVERATMVKHLGTVALSSARSPGPIELARCMVFAVALASRPSHTGKPSIVIVGR
jgi:hypothetical protein